MKLKDVKINVSKEQAVWLWSTVKQAVLSAPRLVLIRYSHALDLVAVMIILVLATLLFVQLTLLDPPAVEDLPDTEMELKTDDIDELELWIEERGNAANDPLNIPSGVEFSAPTSN